MKERLTLAMFIFFILVAWLCIILPAFAAGTGTFVNGKGLIMTNRHVVLDDNDQPVKDFFVFYKNEIYKAHLVSFSFTVDLALVQIDSDINTPCLAIVPNKEAKGQIVYPLLYDFRDGRYIIHYSRMSRFSADIINEKLRVLGQRAFEFGDLARPGNSGSPILNGDNNIISVVFAGHTSPTFQFDQSYGLLNSELMKYKALHPDIVCYFPNTGKDELKQNVVWIQ